MTTELVENVVSVTRRINAPAHAIFEVLCDPSRHVAVDGSGMLRSTPRQRLSAVGDTFVVEMWNAEMGFYEMTSRIVEFETDRLITWEPTMTRASRPEDQEHVGNSAEQRWGFVLEPVDGSTADVTEIFDCTRCPHDLVQAVKGGQGWLEAMTATLERLENLVAAGG